MRFRTLTIAVLALLALAAPGARAGWYTPYATPYAAQATSPGFDIVLRPALPAGPARTTHCQLGTVDGNLAAMTNGSGSAITDVLLRGANCREGTTDASFTCTSGRYQAIVFQALGGVAPTWYGSKTEGFVRSIACSYGISGCVATVTGTWSLNWYNWTATGPTRLYLVGPTSGQDLRFTAAASAPCFTQRLTGIVGIEFHGTSSTPQPDTLELSVTSPVQPRMWEQ